MSVLGQSGAHAAFVLAAYSVSAGGLAALTVASLLSAHRWRRRAQAREKARRA